MNPNDSLDLMRVLLAWCMSTKRSSKRKDEELEPERRRPPTGVFRVYLYEKMQTKVDAMADLCPYFEIC
jgi:hypothetical protein